eukprot:CAMPEP_0182433138 /NCGR_PEP_ID=MMETSP1167-20130531/61150_1 /TAXON_ID=2988 /ORGANISM="Mallomonas Sp, Strain CCMP3275" /LENGTH=423 /DNA_ID=CAMNT_0024621447 /DNA_START=207 /DNA_END=1474 /DNA_ORIENTATION=-
MSGKVSGNKNNSKSTGKLNIIQQKQKIKSVNVTSRASLSDNDITAGQSTPNGTKRMPFKDGVHKSSDGVGESNRPSAAKKNKYMTPSKSMEEDSSSANGSSGNMNVSRVRRFDSKPSVKSSNNTSKKKIKPKRRNSGNYEMNNNRNLSVRLQKWYHRTFNPDIVHLVHPLAIEAARGLQLTQRHLQRLHNVFDSIDIDGAGSIDIKEFVVFLGEDPSSPYISNLFQMIDIDGSGTIEFEEYVRILAVYCMYTKDEILRFCFESFDKDGSNGVSEAEYKELIKEVNANKPMFPDNFKKVLEQFDENQDGVIDYKEFCTMESKFPMILYPAFRLQDAMQRTSLGESEWVRLIEKYRRRLFIEEYQATHGGASPPATLNEQFSRLFCSCFKAPIHDSSIRLGAQLEDKHRQSSATNGGGGGGGGGG